MTREEKCKILDSIENVVSLLIENDNIKFEDFKPVREAISEVELLIVDVEIK
jgi:hypothetical protein